MGLTMRQSQMNQALLTAGAVVKTVAPRLGMVTGGDGVQLKADFSFLTGSSVVFDAVFVPGGDRKRERAFKQETESANFLPKLTSTARQSRPAGPE